jgi:N6-adenosine-specific RNA methylase IME4
MNDVTSPDAMLAELRAANSARGEAQAFIHVGGYAVGLGFNRIKWMLAQERWRLCGFDTLEAFAASMQFDKSMQAAAEQRKELVVLFKQANAAKPISNRKIAKTLNVSTMTVGRDLVTNVTPGQKDAKEINEPKPSTVTNVAPPALPSGGRAANQVVNKAESQEVKQERRDDRERAAAGKILALPDKRYGVFYADPEWRDEVWSRETGLDRAPDNHYSTSPDEIIKSRPVASIAADDSALFLWATVQHLAVAIAVMDGWGFAYKSHLIWRKPSIGLGRWIRSMHEVLLIGTRGSPPAPAPGTQWDSVIDAPRGEHSEKPEKFCELIEAYYPTMPKIELNARIRRPGWDAWGLEAPP